MSWIVNKTRPTKRIENGDSYVVIQKLNQGDKDDLLDVLVQMDTASLNKKDLKAGNVAGAKMQLGAMRHFQRVRSIISWNLKFDDGTPVQISEENIKNLPDDLVAEIDAAIAELNPQGLSDSKKN